VNFRTLSKCFEDMMDRQLTHHHQLDSSHLLGHCFELPSACLHCCLLRTSSPHKLSQKAQSNTHTHNHFMAHLDFVWDYPGEPTPEGNH